ncbi:MAG TPA: hypothetical protein VNH16_25260 [Burkholderiales bacterium]|nr:hypothetical protein [Burkholderiales bacterium]
MTWLQVAIVLALALASWISALDATGNGAENSFLWAVTASAAAWLALRLARRAASG